jgi:asparagine synthase (glutamine-hydrolysing)
VERRLVSDVSLGAFLSGGIDSSAVVAIMSQVNPGATNAFTIAFEEKDYNELPYAELIAQKYKVNHTKLLLRPHDFLDQLPEALNAMDTPSGDGLNTYLVSKAIRKSGIIVALSGIGGDELFAGYPFFKQFLAIKKRKAIFDHSLGLRKALSRLLPASDQKMIRIKELLEVPASDISDIYPIFRQIQNPGVLRRLYGRLQPIEEANTLERNLGSKQQALDRWPFLSQVSIADYLGYTQSVLLKDADQMSMAVSLELREPFFDNDLVEYVLNIPDSFKFPTYPKKLLVESLGDLLPPEIVFRKKQGFVLPYDLWMRSELRGFCDEKIRGLAARGIFDEEKMVAYWNRFLDRRSNIRWADIWIFVVLEHWLEKNQVS